MYTGSTISNLSLIASNFTAGSILTARVNAGMTYLIAADHTNDVLFELQLSLSPSPLNDYFTNRVVLTGNTGAVSGTVVNAGVEPGERSASSSFQTVWWTWTAPDNTGAIFQFSDPSYVLEVFVNDTLESLQPLGLFTFTSHGFGRYTLLPAAGATYQLRVRPTAGTAPFSFIWYQGSALAPNDHIANRAIVTGTNVTVNDDLASATREVGEPTHGPASGNASVWFGWRAPASGTLRFSWNFTSTMTAAFYRGTNFTSLTPLATGLSSSSSSTILTVVSGVDYSFVVDGTIASGAFTLGLLFSPAPSNDDFANRIVLADENPAASGTTAGAGKETGEPNHASSTSRTGSVWWDWQPATSGPVTLVAEGAGLDPVLAVYTGTAINSLVTVASNNDYLPDMRDSRVTFNAVTGTLYHIAVATIPSASGRVNLSVLRKAPPSVSWLQPATNVVLALGASVDVEADASAPSGSISQVTIQDGPNVIARFADAPFSFSLTNLPYTNLTLFAYARDGDGLVSVTTQRLIRVAPPNDIFSNRVVIAQNASSVTGTLSGVIRDTNEPRQLFGANRVAWWSWTAPSNGTVHLAINHAGGSSAVSVYTGSTLGALIVVGTSASRSRVTFAAQAGVEYQIAAEGFGSGGEVVISFVNPRFPLNDYFTNAIPILGTNAVVTESNVEASAETGEPRHGDWTANRSLWWTWTAPANGIVFLATEGSSFDTTLGVYLGNSVSALTNVAGNRTSKLSGNSAVSFRVTHGVTYQIAVDGFFSLGDVRLGFTFVAVPGNDSFDQRFVLNGQTNVVTAHNAAASRESGEPVPSGFGVGRTLWWTWTAPRYGRVTLSTEGSVLKNVLAVYVPFTMNLVAMADSITTTDNTLQFDTAAGATYYLQLDSQSVAAGALTLRLFQPDSASNDHFAQRIPLTGYVANVKGGNFNATLEPSEPVTSQGATVWWSWTAPESRSVSLVTTGAVLPKVAVYTGSSLGALSLVATNFPSGVTLDAATFDTVAGTEYHFSFWLPGNSMEHFQFGLMPNAAPAVAWATPIAGAAFYPGQTIDLNVEATDPDGFVATVMLTAGPFAKLDSLAPYSYSVSNLALGDYQGSARVTDNLGAFTLATVPFRVAPRNDDFAFAMTLTGNEAQVAFENTGASVQVGEPLHVGRPGGRSVWFVWTAPETGVYAVSTEGSSFNTLLAVYEGAGLSNLLQTAANDDRNLYDAWSEVRIRAVVGTTYALAVDGRNGATGSGWLMLNPVAANDQFENAASLAGFDTTRTRNVGAALQADEPFHNGTPAGGSLWWDWLAPRSGRYRVVTAGSDFDTVLGIYSGQSVSNLTRIGSDDDSAGSGASVVRFDAISGEKYHIAVAGHGTSRGNIQLTVATNGAPTLFRPLSVGQTSFVFRALTEPGTTNAAQRSPDLINWTSFATNNSGGWWVDFIDTIPPGNSARFHRVRQQ